MKKTYIFYSGATDATGEALQKKLGIDGGIKKPTSSYEVIIGWGTKTKEAMSFDKTTKILNHPDKIAVNRDKFGALKLLKKGGVSVGDFVSHTEVREALSSNKLKFPLVGRQRFHQGGKGFWMCLTVAHVDVSISEGAEYFQEFIDIKDEYRLHIFEDELLYAQKKVKRDNLAEAFAEQHKEKLINAAEKAGTKLDEATMKFIMDKMAKEAPTPDMVIRSNTRGWKFSHIPNTSIPKELVEQAVGAVKAIGLTFGAVDCCTDTTGKKWVIEVNSGPGLDGTTFDAYIKKFEEILAEKPAVAKKSIGTIKERLKAYIDKAPEAELETVGNIFADLWSADKK